MWQYEWDASPYLLGLWSGLHLAFVTSIFAQKQTAFMASSTTLSPAIAPSLVTAFLKTNLPLFPIRVSVSQNPALTAVTYLQFSSALLRQKWDVPIFISRAFEVR